MRKFEKVEKAEMIENYVANLQSSLISAFEGFAYRYIANVMDDIENLSQLEKYKNNPEEFRDRVLEFELEYTVEMLERVSKLIDTFNESMEEMDDVTPDDYNDFIKELFECYFVMLAIIQNIVREV